MSKEGKALPNNEKRPCCEGDSDVSNSLSSHIPESGQWSLRGIVAGMRISRNEALHSSDLAEPTRPGISQFGDLIGVTTKKGEPAFSPGSPLTTHSLAHLSLKVKSNHAVRPPSPLKHLADKLHDHPKYQE